jgi:2-desacetyl-2-hydroxyethyl bacteriochlorophyllide A dehydrogenase
MTTSETLTIRAVEWTLESAGRLQRAVTTLPSPSADEILVTTTCGAISPGWERTLLHGTCPAVPPNAYPYQPGQLNVVRITDAVDRTLIGERGVAVLGHRDHALIPYHRFIRIPATASDELALLGTLAADARQAIDLASVEQGEDCLVLGGGILGVLTAWELALRTRGRLRLVERERRRRDLLREIRFPREITIADNPGRDPFHTVFDCANGADAFADAQESARPGGSIVLIADGSHEDYTLAADFFAKGLFLGKVRSRPDLRGFLNEFFARESVRFEDFPRAYLESLLRPPGEREGLLPRVVYGS